MVLVDDAEQASDETPATPVNAAASAYNDGDHGGQPDVHRRSTRQRFVPAWHKDRHVQERL